MKYTLPFLSLLFSAIIACVYSDDFSQKDYCQFESGEVCDGVPHVACPSSTSNFQENMDTFVDFKYHPLSEAQKTSIVRQFNTFKNEVAGGTYSDDGLLSATGFEVLKWDDECAYISSKVVKKLGFLAETFSGYCYVYEDSANIYMSQYNETVPYTENAVSEEYIADFVTKSVDNLTKEWKDNDIAYWGGYFGPAKFVGCSMVSYTDSEETQRWRHFGINCMFKTISGTVESYPTGKSCSDCTACDLVYTNLCASE